MAQQLGMMRVKGKLGNVVGFSNSTSLKANRQFYREKATKVYNPKTEKQAAQRAKISPAQAFYRAFEGILNHAFLPSKKATLNRYKFMMGAMSLDAIPDVRKGDAYLPVLPYVISQGGLGLDRLTVPQLNAQGRLDFGGLLYDTSIDNNVADYTNRVLGTGVGLKEGYEITLLVISASSTNDYVRKGSFLSIVLDRHNTINTKSELFANKPFTVESGCVVPADGSSVILAAGLIISAKTKSSWAYTSSKMYLSQYGLDLPNIELEVIRSYMASTVSATSELILQQADNEPTYTGVSYVGLRDVDVLNDSEHQGTISPTKCTVVVTSLGTLEPVIDNNKVLLHKESNGTWVQLIRTNEGVSAPVTIDTTNLADNTVMYDWYLESWHPELYF